MAYLYSHCSIFTSYPRQRSNYELSQRSSQDTEKGISTYILNWKSKLRWSGCGRVHLRLVLYKITSNVAKREMVARDNRSIGMLIKRLYTEERIK